MIFFQDSRIAGIHANWVGNKNFDEGVSFREEPSIFGGMYSPDEKLHMDHLILTAISRPFSKYETVFQFREINETLELNDSYKAVVRFFHNWDSFQSTANNLTALLYEYMLHPKISSGILLAVHLKDVQFEGEEMEAIALLKLSNPMEGLDFRGKGGRYDIWPSGKIFSVENVELSAIFINTDRENGYRILLQCPPKSIEGYLWREEFLQLQVVNDPFQMTSNFMKVYKNFVMEKLEESHEMDTMDQYELLNKAISYVSENETMDIEEFSGTVIQDPEVSSIFNRYLDTIQEDHEMVIPDRFPLSDSAVKKAKSAYKKVIKLDKNFHIYVHGKRELVEQGYDESKGMNFYKVYYENES
ncbi:nucleoid-associated protein [Sphingobacterium cellulitidis]|uniref:nucleoid-associated protein n=1 Tax=Sphingobacterium cellulitidis TaxID=1768011 RepID=UPI00370D27AD